ncbi:MAG: hypothetical protein JWO67_2970 [Streptosporangiaceae bacterium]|jgi:2-dehydropantoate 2-reductase|nr:hypothetical protein [Streptosporangiaceae bacterium]
MNPSQREYTIVGAGAIGGTLAWHLARAGHPVTVVDRDPSHIAAIASDGIVLQVDGMRVPQPVVAALRPEQVSEPLGRVLLAVKAHATEGAAAWLAEHLAPDGFVVSLQNGLNEDLIAQHIGAERTVGAFVDLFADVVAPGVIADGGAGAIAVGEMSGAASPRVRDLAADLRAWGHAVVTRNVAGYLWAKLGFGAMLTATALADDAMGDLLDRHRAAGHALAGEVLSVATAEGIALEPFDAFEPDAYMPAAAGLAGAGAMATYLAASGFGGSGLAVSAARDVATDRLVAWLRTQTKTRSGIWRDIVVRHRATEIPTHYAPVLAAAGRHRIHVPVLRALLEQLAEVEADPATMNEARLATLDAIATKEYAL